jgi:tetratricopeptide (TPR) repeat protein
MAQRFSTADVARVLGVPAARVRAFVRAGWCAPERRGRRLEFGFQELVVLRAARALHEARVPAARVKRALRALARELGGGRPLSGVRIVADGRRVVVRDERAGWEPESGQLVLDFSLNALAREAARVVRARDADDERALAQQAFRQALALEESDSAAARRAYRRALARDPKLVDALVNLGRLVHEAGRAREAVALYRRALAETPDDAEVHYNLALALEDMSGPEAAITAYQRALALDPSFADAHWNLAGLCEATGKPADALRHYKAYERLTR